ncbi:MAG: hypothetical protein WD578_03955 [Bacteroidales bacterium]
MMNPIVTMVSAIFITIIGALPFGLVNLSVLDISYRRGQGEAMNISRGAAAVEVTYGLAALVTGGLIGQFIKNNHVVQFLVLSVPALAGLFFLLKGKQNQSVELGNSQGFLKGMLLNLISLQVLLYWLFAMTYLHTLWEIDNNVLTITLFAIGIWLGKMGVLRLYAILSKKISGRLGFLSKNINRIIGVVLLLTVVVQLIRVCQ